MRGVLAGAGGGGIARQAALEVVVGLGWFAVAAAPFRWFAEGGRKDGSLEFGS